ncbi:glycosyltransferase [Crocinitomix sp.]|nr:glycosyltransferase [Crocinitomix sp.]
MKKRTVLNIISESYPFGRGEQFFDIEIKELSKYFDEIRLFPLTIKSNKRAIPENVSVNLSLSQYNRVVSKLFILQNIYSILRVYLYEFRSAPQRKILVKNAKLFIERISQNLVLAKKFEAEIDENLNLNFFYSFWMNDGALLLSLLKSKGKINSFFFRVNGFDLFNERHEGNYLPFRHFIYKNVSRIFVLSKGALDYLIKLNIYQEKLILVRNGVYEKGLNPFSPASKIANIVSCSNVISLKRIDKIIEALKLVDDRVVCWTHFGDGELLDDIKSRAKTLPSNISTIFKGSVEHGLILKHYNTEPVNLFIHTSESEGLGLAIIEAQSFGIPAVVIGVGGVVDIVNEQTGIVLQPDTTNLEISESIRKVLDGPMNNDSYRKIIQKKCLTTFDVNFNYRKLYQLITK